MYSSAADLPAGADYWRDSFPLGPNHSSRNLREMPSNPSLRHSDSQANLMGPQHRVQSMAGMSMWGPGSDYGGGAGAQMPMGQQHPSMMPFLNPMMTGMSHSSMAPQNPYGYTYASPVPSDYGMRPHTMFGPYANNAAPRNSVMTNLGQYALGGDSQNRMSSYSLATSLPAGGASNPFAGGTPGVGVDAGVNSEPLVSSDKEDPTDEEVLGVLKRYLAQQDLMSV